MVQNVWLLALALSFAGPRPVVISSVRVVRSTCIALALEVLKVVLF